MSQAFLSGEHNVVEAVTGGAEAQARAGHVPNDRFAVDILRDPVPLLSRVPQTRALPHRCRHNAKVWSVAQSSVDRPTDVLIR